MVFNKFVKCKFCGEVFNIRAQIGFTNMPINIYCPHCGSRISGEFLVDNINLSSQISLNAYENDEIKPPYFRIELSQEFMTFKFMKCEDERDLFVPTPFLRNFSMIGENEKEINSIINFTVNSVRIAEGIENLFYNLRNENFEYIKHYFANVDEPLCKYYIEHTNFDELQSKIDYLMLTKQYTYSALISITDVDEILTLVKKDFEYNSKKKSINYFLNFLQKNLYFETYFEEKIVRYFSEYIRLFKQILPVFLNKKLNKSIDFEIYGITTANVADILNIYSNGYELFADAIDLTIGLDNIYERGEYDNFANGRQSFREKISSYANKFNKIDYFCNSDNFPICKSLNSNLSNRIRNPIAHYDWKVDGITQKISLTDKRKGITTDLFVAELVEKTISMFNKLYVLWEYYYQFYKIKLIKIDKIKFNYKFFK